MDKNKIAQKILELRSIIWVRLVFYVGIPLLMIKIINPEWLGRVIAYISIFLIIIVIIARELLRTNYDHVTIFDAKTKKVVIAVTRILGLICWLFLLYGSINYSKDIIFLVKNKKPIEVSGVITELRTPPFAGFGLLGQFLDVRLTGQEESKNFTLVLHPIVRQDSNIKFYYLPNSKLIVQILDK